jgi:hypothetical protein
MESLRAAYDEGQDPDLTAIPGADPHTVAGLLKLYLRTPPHLSLDQFWLFASLTLLPSLSQAVLHELAKHAPNLFARYAMKFAFFSPAHPTDL